MSENEDTKNEEPRSIFDGPAEEPEEGANVMDESSSSPGKIDPGSERTVTEEGHLKMKVDTGGIDPFDHSPELEARHKKEKSEGTAPPDLPETEEVGINNPAVMGTPSDRLKEEMEARFAMDYGDIEVKVTQAEREAFVRAALHDTEMQFDIEVEGVGHPAGRVHQQRGSRRQGLGQAGVHRPGQRYAVDAGLPADPRLVPDPGDRWGAHRVVRLLGGRNAQDRPLAGIHEGP